MTFNWRFFIVFVVIFFGHTQLMAAFTFAQITDLHISDKLTDKNFERLDRVLKHMQSQQPHFFIVTGDLTRNVSTGIDYKRAYQILTEKLEAVKIPYYLIPGNHDFLDLFHQVFAPSDHLKNKGFYAHAFAYRNVLFYGLDTLYKAPSKPKGFLAQEQLKWLKDSIVYNKQEKPYKKIVVFLHQPPITRKNAPIFIKSPFERLYDYCFEENSADELFKILNAYPEANTLLTGHLHLGAVIKLPFDKYLYTCPSVGPTKKAYLNKAFMMKVMGAYVSKDPGYSHYHYDEETDILDTCYYFIDKHQKSRKVTPRAITAIDFMEQEKPFSSMTKKELQKDF